MAWFLLVVAACLGLGELVAVVRGQPQGEAKGPLTYELVRVDVTRRYQFTPADPKAKLVKPGLEYVKAQENTGRFEFEATRAGYGCKGVLTVDAPAALTEGQPLTVKVKGESTIDPKLAEPSATLRVVQTLWAPGREEKREIIGSGEKPVAVGEQTLSAEASVTVTVGEDASEKGKSPAVRAWEKDGVRYRGFTVTLSCLVGAADVQSVEAVYVYRQGEMAAPTPKAKATPPSVSPVAPSAPPTPPVPSEPAEPAFQWWWLLLIVAAVLAVVVLNRKRQGPGQGKGGVGAGR
jgi:hypothetical protein